MKRAEGGGILFRFALLLTLLLVVALGYLLRYPLLRAAGGYWVVEDPPQPSDAILLLSGYGRPTARVPFAAALYRGHWAPRIVVSGALLGGGDTLAELTVRDLAAYGVPRDALVSSPASTGNTREEAQALADLVVKRGWRRILVVTSNYHTRRARYIFQRVFPPDVKVRILAAPETDYDPDRWWKTRQGRRLFFRETLAYCRAIWELRVIASSVVPTTTVSVGREP